MKHIRISSVIALALLACSCGEKDQPAATFNIDMQSVSFKAAGGSKLANVKTTAAWKASPDASWISVSPASGEGNGIVKIEAAANTGDGRKGCVTFECGSIKREVKVEQDGASDGPGPSDDGRLDPSAALAKSLGADIIHSQGVLLHKTGNIMQGFDFTDPTHYYYSQSPNGTTQYVTMCPGPNAGKSSVMTLEQFGHMTQIVAEAVGSKTYIWCNSNGVMDSSNACGDNLSFSRIEYKAGGGYTGGYAGDTWFLSKKYSGKPHMDLQVSVDFNARRLLVGTRVSGVSIRFFWVYDLDAALSLPLKDITVSVGGTSRTVRGRELADLETLGYFEIPRGATTSDVYYYSHQGHEVYGDYVWFYEGNANGSGPYTSVAYVTVYDYKGKVVTPRTMVNAISDNDKMKTLGFSADGYAEGESLKVKDGKLYLGMACHNEAGRRIQNILVYECEKL